MQADIARWKAEIEKRGLLKARSADDKDWMSVDGEGSIFQLRLSNVYIRAVWSEGRENPQAPFAFWRFEAKNSEEFPDNILFPKNEFIGTTKAAEYLSASEIELELFGTSLE